MYSDFKELFQALSRSKFRSRFHLTGRDREYAEVRGPEAMARHARVMLDKRLFVAAPAKDGKQTPYRGHPVFVGQHATGTCCRSCLMKWHKVPKGRALTDEERDYVVDVLVAWMRKELSGPDS